MASRWEMPWERLCLEKYKVISDYSINDLLQYL